MKSDYLEPGDQVFCNMGKRYGVDKNGRTVCIGSVDDVAPVTAGPAPVSAAIVSDVTSRTNNKEVSLQGKGILYTHTGKRGRPSCQIPEDTIRQLAFKGMGSKLIAKELKSQGVEVSYQTIERRLAGVK
jgi:hypothetical protein